MLTATDFLLVWSKFQYISIVLNEWPQNKKNHIAAECKGKIKLLNRKNNKTRAEWDWGLTVCVWCVKHISSACAWTNTFIKRHAHTHTSCEIQALCVSIFIFSFCCCCYFLSSSILFLSIDYENCAVVHPSARICPPPSGESASDFPVEQTLPKHSVKIRSNQNLLWTYEGNSTHPIYFLILKTCIEIRLFFNRNVQITQWNLIKSMELRLTRNSACSSRVMQKSQ